MKDAKIYRILVADMDTDFMRRLCDVLNKISEQYDDVQLRVIPTYQSNHKKPYCEHNFNLAFIDYSIIIDDKNMLISNLHNNNPECLLVLLIDDKGGLQINKLVKKLEQQGQPFFGEHLLKDNYSIDLLTILCKGFIERIISK